MRNAGHTESVAKGKFLMVCTGETYSAEIVQGTDLLEKILEALCGDDADAKAKDHEFYEELLDEPENWGFDGDRLEPTTWSIDVGETDHIQLFLITE